MLHSIKKLIGDKGRQLIVPIVLMSLDAIGSLVMYLMLYFTVVHLLSGTLSRYTCTELYHCMLDKRNTSADHI